VNFSILAYILIPIILNSRLGSLTPKYLALRRFVLAVSCIPSLAVCYVTEVLTQHNRTSWSSFEPQGKELVRRWYKKSWADDTNLPVDKIVSKLDEVVMGSVEEIAKALAAKTKPVLE
jgi:hypothetical protein